MSCTKARPLTPTARIDCVLGTKNVFLPFFLCLKMLLRAASHLLLLQFVFVFLLLLFYQLKGVKKEESLEHTKEVAAEEDEAEAAAGVAAMS